MICIIVKKMAKKIDNCLIKNGFLKSIKLFIFQQNM